MRRWVRARGPRLKAGLGALVAAAVVLLGWWLGSWPYRERLLSERRAHVAAELSLRGYALSRGVAERLAVLRGLYAFTQLEASEPQFGDHFAGYAARLCEGTDAKAIRYVAIAPGGVVGYVYPADGNESTIGYDPLQDPRPEVRAAAQRAIDSQQIVLGIPGEPTQGRQELIAQQAVYLPLDPAQGPRYWGLVRVVLDLPSLLAEAELDDQEELVFALHDSAGGILYGSEQVSAMAPVTSQISLPDGAWRLATIPVVGWQASIRGSLTSYWAWGATIILLLAVLTYLALSRQAYLSAAVDERTRALTVANERLRQDVVERERAAAALQESEAALRTTEASFRGLFEQAPFAMQICAPDGRTLRVNRAYRELWGCNEAQIVGSNLLAGECFLRPDVLPHIQRAFAGRPVSLPAQRYTPREVPTIQHGQAHWVNTYVYPLKDDEGQIERVIAVLEDVTAQREAAEALRVSEERFRRAFDDAAIGMGLIDTDGRFLRANASLCRMFGYDEGELQAKTFQELTHPDDLQLGANLFRDLVAGERDAGWLEKRYIHKDGHVIWALLSTSAIRDAQGRLVYLVSQVQDFTERKEAEARLIEKEAQYRSIFEATSDGLVISDLQGRIVEINPAACAMYGYDREQAVGRLLASFVHADSRDLFDEVFEGIRRGEGFVVQAVDQRQDGTPFHVEVYGSSFTYAGEPHLLSVIRDVTERVQAVQLLEQRVRERTRELSTLLRVSRDVASTLDLEPLLSAVLDRLGEIVAYDAAAVLIAGRDEEMTLAGYRGPVPRESVPEHLYWHQITHLCEVLERREPLIIPDVRAGDALARSWREATRNQLGHLPAYVASWMGVPLLARDRIVGMLSLEHSEADHYTDYHAELALAFASQVAVAIDNARLYERSQRLAVVEERQRIARELHDSVSQALYGIGLGARTARAHLDRDPSGAVEPVEYVLSLAEAALAEMRALIFELRPDALEREGLVSALHKRAASLHSRYDLQVEADLGEEPRLPIEAKEALYRVAQEALNNVIKHARASHVAVRMNVEGPHIVLSVEDDGVGFRTLAEYPGHIGLHTMRERIEEIGGQLTIESVLGQGTRLEVSVPLDRT
ncbi:MAG: PAS domain S-box protein [Anaerolineae bacterium]